MPQINPDHRACVCIALVYFSFSARSNTPARPTTSLPVRTHAQASQRPSSSKPKRKKNRDSHAERWSMQRVFFYSSLPRACSNYNRLEVNERKSASFTALPSVSAHRAAKVAAVDTLLRQRGLFPRVPGTAPIK